MEETKKKNNIIIIIVGVVLLLTGVVVGLLLSGVFNKSDKSDDNQNNTQNTTVEDNTKQFEDSDDTSADKDGYIGIKTKYLSKTLKSYNIRLAKKTGGDKPTYAVYDADKQKILTDYDFHDGPYASQREGNDNFDIVEQAARVYVFHSGEKDYLYIYVVASGHADGISYGMIYVPETGELKELRSTTAYTFKDGVFGLRLSIGHDDISSGWYFDFASSDGVLREVLLFVKNGNIITLKSSFMMNNSDESYTLVNMPLITDYEEGNYSSSKAIIYDATGNVAKTYNNVVAVREDYVVVQEDNKLVLYDIKGNAKTIEENTNKDYVYYPYIMEIDGKYTLNRQNKSIYHPYAQNGDETLQLDIK